MRDVGKMACQGVCCSISTTPAPAPYLTFGRCFLGAPVCRMNAHSTGQQLPCQGVLQTTVAPTTTHPHSRFRA